jgi:hypothetical protein
MIGINWNDGHELLGPDGGETLSAYLRARAPTKSPKKQEGNR